ncbi:hypothetical protein FRC10_009004 [Ceratobasidium sp. 414]|nr:hypothetical protein FRC10_009004 [Ceratobasidium sp. 414]
MSHASAGSTKSYTASEICKYEDKFNLWAKEVPAVYKPRIWDPIPSGPIADMVKESQHLPEWLFKKELSEYKIFEKLHLGEVDDILVGMEPKKRII